jgi:hypothetical protein
MLVRFPWFASAACTIYIYIYVKAENIAHRWVNTVLNRYRRCEDNTSGVQEALGFKLLSTMNEAPMLVDQRTCLLVSKSMGMGFSKLIM